MGEIWHGMKIQTFNFFILFSCFSSFLWFCIIVSSFWLSFNLTSFRPKFKLPPRALLSGFASNSDNEIHDTNGFNRWFHITPKNKLKWWGLSSTYILYLDFISNQCKTWISFNTQHSLIVRMFWCSYLSLLVLSVAS